MDMRSIKFVSFLVLLALALVACGGSKAPLNVGEPASKLKGGTVPPQRILVIGGTAGIGLETVKLALARGHSVSAMSRKPERVTLSHENLKLVQSDVLDPSSVNQALVGHDAVVLSVGMKPTRKPVTMFSEGTKNVLSAMSENGIERLLLVTGIGAGESRGHGGFFYDNILLPLMLNTIYEDKDRSEQLVLDSSTQWTIVRPGFLDDTESTASYRVVKDIEGVTSGDISRADVAHFMLSALENEEYIQSTVLISN